MKTNFVFNMNTVKKFLNLSRDECLKVIPAIVENAHVLFKTAEEASRNSNFGVATSLTILGAEELIKGMILYLNGQGVNVFQVKEIKGVFSKHQTKHELGELFELLRIAESIQNFEERDSLPKRKPSGVKLIDKIIYFLDQTTSVLNPIVKMTEYMEWWESANTLKNKGLYVDFLDGLKSPSDLKLSDYETAKSAFADLNDKYRWMLVLFERTPEEVREILNDGIKLLLRGEAMNES